MHIALASLNTFKHISISNLIALEKIILLFLFINATVCLKLIRSIICAPYLSFAQGKTL